MPLLPNRSTSTPNPPHGQRYRTWLSCLLGCLFTWAALPAQSLEFTRYNQENGLPEDYIYTLVQDPKGFLYLGTVAGLYRFDGLHFTPLTTANGLADDFVTACLRDSKGRIWLGHDHRVSYMRDGKATALADTSTIQGRVVAIAQDGNGDIWCASQRNGLYLVDTASILLTFTEGLDEGQIVYSMACGKFAGKDYLLVGTDLGLNVYTFSGKRKPKLAYSSTKVPLTKIMCIAPRLQSTGFWLGTEDAGLVLFSPAADDSGSVVQVFDDKSGLLNLNVQAIAEAPGGILWIGAEGKGFYKYRFGSDNTLAAFRPAHIADTISMENVRAIYMDGFGQTWMGTYGSGLMCIGDQTFATFRMQQDSTSRLELRCLLEDKQGDLWIGTNAGLYVVDKEILRSSGMRYTIGGILTLPHKAAYTKETGLPSDAVTCLIQDPTGRIWAGTADAGVARLDPGAKSFAPQSLSQLALSNNINSLACDKQGNLWVGTSDGAFSLNPSTGETHYYGTQNKLPHNNIYDILADKSGQVWFATHTNRVAIFNGKDIETKDVTDHGEIPNITCIAQDKEGKNIWLGTDGSGLYRYDGKTFKQYTKADGLQSNFVYQLLIDHYGQVWTTHRDGFSRHIPETGWFLTYPAKTITPMEENSPLDAIVDAGGNLWFCTEYGLLEYGWDPNRNNISAPYTFIQSITVNDSLYPIHSEIELPYDSYRLTFSYLGLSFLHQEDVRYQYRLEGREPEWSDLTPQESATFQALEDGEYTFQVRACNRYGRCNESAAKIKIVILPPYWKTWWFRGLIVLVLVALVYAYVRYREYRLNKEKADLEEKVRQRTNELQLEKEKVELANIELEKLSLVASETDNAVFIVDKDGKLTWVNAGFTRLTGLTFEDLMNLRGDNEFVRTSSNPKIKEMLDRAILENRSVQYESKLPSKSGEEIWVLSTLTPILHADGSLKNIVIIDSDISDQKRAEEQIRRMNAELESQVAARTRELAEANQSLQVENDEHIKTAERLKVINSELDNFVYRASHDLKGPTASLIGLVNIAGMELSENPVAARYLGLMDKAAKRLDGILYDLIEATQVKQRTVELIQIPACEFAKGIVESMKNFPDIDKVKIELDIDPDLKIVSDETLLNSILTSFIGNAIRYRDPNKGECRVTVGIGKVADKTVLSVADNGIGIPEQNRSRVFDMFFKGSGSTGSGLGLYIVKQAADKLHGNIYMESTHLEGTTMFVELPA